MRGKPFELSPDSTVLFLGESHKETLAGLKQGLVSDTGFLLLTGGVGTGKTTLVNLLVKTHQVPGYCCVISNPTLDIDDFFAYFAATLGLPFDGNKAKFLVLFAKMLEDCQKTKKKVLLVIDEAHALPTDLLEELRLLGNLAIEVRNVLSVLLVGQPELLDRLTEEQLSSLRQRIVVRCHLDDLSLQDCLQYIRFRLDWAGAQGRTVFTEPALKLVYEATRGNPRQINILCDNVLFAASSHGVVEVDARWVRECAERLHIQGDDRTFFLSPEKNIWSIRLIAMVLVILLAEGAVLAYAYRQGWLAPVYQFLMRLSGLG
jgi:general secretion pathway protein A